MNTNLSLHTIFILRLDRWRVNTARRRLRCSRSARCRCGWPRRTCIQAFDGGGVTFHRCVVYYAVSRPRRSNCVTPRPPSNGTAIQVAAGSGTIVDAGMMVVPRCPTAHQGHRPRRSASAHPCWDQRESPHRWRRFQSSSRDKNIPGMERRRSCVWHGYRQDGCRRRHRNPQTHRWDEPHRNLLLYNPANGSNPTSSKWPARTAVGADKLREIFRI